MMSLLMAAGNVFFEKAGDGENKWRRSRPRFLRSQDAPRARGYKEKIRRAYENQADFGE